MKAGTQQDDYLDNIGVGIIIRMRGVCRKLSFYFLQLMDDIVTGYMVEMNQVAFSVSGVIKQRVERSRSSKSVKKSNRKVELIIIQMGIRIEAGNIFQVISDD